MFWNATRTLDRPNRRPGDEGEGFVPALKQIPPLFAPHMLVHPLMCRSFFCWRSALMTRTAFRAPHVHTGAICILRTSRRPAQQKETSRSGRGDTYRLRKDAGPRGGFRHLGCRAGPAASARAASPRPRRTRGRTGARAARNLFLFIRNRGVRLNAALEKRTVLETKAPPGCSARRWPSR